MADYFDYFNSFNRTILSICKVNNKNPNVIPLENPYEIIYVDDNSAQEVDTITSPAETKCELK